MADVEDEALEPWTCTAFSQRVAEDPVFLDRISRHFDMLTPLQQMRIILSLVYCPPQDPPRAYLDLLCMAQESDNDGRNDDDEDGDLREQGADWMTEQGFDPLEG